ncbi:MAG TPA: hypothetical protein VFN10_07300, partial [Thermoanaerobaculia bacterium]|nr:hypothetical protein [Thermoanaerobaculia bacterium]
MYVLLGIDTVVRIAAALLILFVLVPALAYRRPRELDRMEWFWWCFAAGCVLLTLFGQLATLVNIAAAPTLFVALAAFIVIVRARTRQTTPVAIIRNGVRAVVLSVLNILEGRVNLARRMRRVARHSRRFFARTFATNSARFAAGGWATVGVLAAIPRFYRPFATANLGFSDTYVHLYLMRLLEEGRQVDPAWGPYPRGMHFLLLAIEQLTNVDAILLMNFFGAAAGVLIVLAVADTARRLTKSLAAGLLAGAIFATMIGGAHQYFLFGGSIATMDPIEGHSFVGMPFGAIPPTNGEFDVLLTVFQRQTATLPQELALVLLLPAIWFLLRSLRERSRWTLSGFLFSTAAIAAIHPGVVVPLV